MHTYVNISEPNYTTDHVTTTQMTRHNSNARAAVPFTKDYQVANAGRLGIT